MNQMAKLVHDDVFNAVPWRFEKALVQRDDSLLRQAGAQRVSMSRILREGFCTPYF